MIDLKTKSNKRTLKKEPPIMDNQKNNLEQKPKEFSKRMLLLWLVGALIFCACLPFIFKPAVGLVGKIKTNLSQLLPSDHPMTQLREYISQNFSGDKGDIIVLVHSPDAKKNRQAIDDLAKILRSHPQVEEVFEHVHHYEFYRKHKLLYLDEIELIDLKETLVNEINRKKLGGLFVDLMEEEEESDQKFDKTIDKYRWDIHKLNNRYRRSLDGDVFLLKLTPKSANTSLKFYKKFSETITSFITKEFEPGNYHPEMKLYFDGGIFARTSEYNAVFNNLKTAGYISAIGIGVLLFFAFSQIRLVFFRFAFLSSFFAFLLYAYFSFDLGEGLKTTILGTLLILTIAFFFLIPRSISIVILFIPLILGVITGFGVSSIWVENLNLVTSGLISILFGLGIDIGIHMLMRYYQEREAQKTVRQSLYAMIFKTGRSSAIGILTTAATFFILTINDFRGFSEFGLIAGIGMVCTLFAYFILMPFLLFGCERIKLIRNHQLNQNNWLFRFQNKWQRFPFPVTLICLFLILIGGSILGSSQINFEWNYGKFKFRAEDTETARELLNKVEPSGIRPAVVLVNSKDEAKTIQDYISNHRKNNLKDPLIERFFSPYDIVPQNQAAKIKVLKEIEVVLSDDALNLFAKEKKDLISDFLSLIQAVKPVKEDQIPKKLVQNLKGKNGDQIGFIYPISKYDLNDGRRAQVFRDSLADLKLADGSPKTVLSDYIVYAEVLDLMFSDSYRAILLSFLAVAFFLWLDFRNFKDVGLLLLSLSVGFILLGGLTYLFGQSLNLFNMVVLPIILGMSVDNSVHLLHRFKEYGEKTITKPWLTAGLASLLSSVTTIMGYIGLTVTTHPGLKSVGFLAVIGMVCCILASLVFLPALIEKMIVQKNKRLQKQ